MPVEAGRQMDSEGVTALDRFVCREVSFLAPNVDNIDDRQA